MVADLVKKGLLPYYQKKTQLNALIFQILCEGLPMRGIARTLKLSKNTLEKKFHWLFEHISSHKLQPHLDIEKLYFDEFETDVFRRELSRPESNRIKYYFVDDTL